MSDYKTDIPTIWKMFDESTAEAHRAALVAHQSAQGSRVLFPGSGALNVSALNAVAVNGSGDVNQDVDLPNGELMLQAVVTLGEKTTEGHLIAAVTIPWFQIVAALRRDPQLMHQLDPRAWEEMLAGAYKAAGYDVILTPRSNDKGVDVIATLDDVVSIRIIDQMKAYAPGHLVPASDVRDLIGSLTTHPTASKCIITTTSDFAPGIYTDPEFKRLMPTRLDLRPGPKLLDWMQQIREGR